MATNSPTYWYRLEDRLVSTGEDSPPTVKVTCYKLLVVRKTPKGVRLVGLQYGHDNSRFVAHDTRKKFACATLEEAVENFKKRKRRQASILRARAAHADKAHDIAHLGNYHVLPARFNIDFETRSACPIDMSAINYYGDGLLK